MARKYVSPQGQSGSKGLLFFFSALTVGAAAFAVYFPQVSESAIQRRNMIADARARGEPLRQKQEGPNSMWKSMDSHLKDMERSEKE